MSTDERLDRLENQMRFYKRLVVVLALVIVAGVTMGQTANLIGDTETLMPTILESINKGNYQAIAGIVSNHRAAKQTFGVIRATELQITTATGQIVGIFGTAENRPALAILNRFGTLLGFLGESDSGHGLFRLFNSDGKDAILGGIDPSGHGGVDVFNKDGKRVGGLSVNPFGHGTLEVFDQEGTRIGYFGANQTGNGVVQTMNGVGQLIWQSGQTTSSGLLGDLNDDNNVNFADFLIFAQNFGKSR